MFCFLFVVVVLFVDHLRWVGSAAPSNHSSFLYFFSRFTFVSSRYFSFICSFVCCCQLKVPLYFFFFGFCVLCFFFGLLWWNELHPLHLWQKQMKKIFNSHTHTDTNTDTQLYVHPYKRPNEQQPNRSETNPIVGLFKYWGGHIQKRAKGTSNAIEWEREQTGVLNSRWYRPS